MLKLEDVHAAYGQTKVLHGISLEVGACESVALVGANGAGKTTTLRVISGMLPAASGRIVFDGRDISRAPVASIVRLGISHVPEGRQLFGSMSVKDNLLLGTYPLPPKERAAGLSSSLDMVYSLFPVLEKRGSQTAGTLSGGEQQMLAIARALMAKPRLLLLDEPSMGLAPLVMNEIFRVISDLRSSGLTILLVEQNARWALKICQRAYVMETGRVVRHGDSSELAGDDAVMGAYLGKRRVPAQA